MSYLYEHSDSATALNDKVNSLLSAVEKTTRMATRKTAHDLLRCAELACGLIKTDAEGANLDDPMYPKTNWGEYCNANSFEVYRDKNGRNILKGLLALIEVARPGTLSSEGAGRVVDRLAEISDISAMRLGTVTMDLVGSYMELGGDIGALADAFAGMADTVDDPIAEVISGAERMGAYDDVIEESPVTMYSATHDTDDMVRYVAAFHGIAITFDVHDGMLQNISVANHNDVMSAVDEISSSALNYGLIDVLTKRIMGHLIDEGGITRARLYEDYIPYNDLVKRPYLIKNSTLKFAAILRGAIDDGMVSSEQVADVIFKMLVGDDTTNAFIKGIVASCGYDKEDVVRLPANGKLLLFIARVFGNIPYSTPELHRIFDRRGATARTELYNLVYNGYAPCATTDVLLALRAEADDRDELDKQVIELWANGLVRLSDRYVCTALDYSHCSPNTIKHIAELVEPLDWHPEHARYFIERYCNSRFRELVMSMGGEDTRRETAAKLQTLFSMYSSGSTASSPFMTSVDELSSRIGFDSPAGVIDAMQKFSAGTLTDTQIASLVAALSDFDMFADVVTISHPDSVTDMADMLVFMKGRLGVPVTDEWIVNLFNELIIIWGDNVMRIPNALAALESRGMGVAVQHIMNDAGICQHIVDTENGALISKLFEMYYRVEKMLDRLIKILTNTNGDTAFLRARLLLDGCDGTGNIEFVRTVITDKYVYALLHKRDNVEGHPSLDIGITEREFFMDSLFYKWASDRAIAGVLCAKPMIIPRVGQFSERVANLMKEDWFQEGLMGCNSRNIVCAIDSFVILYYDYNVTIPLNPNILGMRGVTIVGHIKRYCAEHGLDANRVINALGLSSFNGTLRKHVIDRKNDTLLKTVEIGPMMWSEGYYSGNGNGVRAPANSNVVLFGIDELSDAIPEGWHIPTYDELDAIGEMVNDTLVFGKTGMLNGNGKELYTDCGCFWRQPIEGEEEGPQIAAVRGHDVRPFVDIDDQSGCKAAIRLVQD